MALLVSALEAAVPAKEGLMRDTWQLEGSAPLAQHAAMRYTQSKH